MKLFRWPFSHTPRIRIAARFPMPAADSGRLYHHPTYAIHQYLYDGSVTIGRTEIAFRAGDITITPPGAGSVYQVAEGGHHWCIHFDPTRPAPHEPLFTLPLHLAVARSDVAHIRERFAVICDTLRPRGADRRESRFALPAAGALLQALLLLLAQERMRRPAGRHSRSRSQVALDKTLEWLDSHFQHPVRIGELAATSGLSRNFFALRFREKFGMTVNRYLLRRRVEMAKYLLLSTNRTIKEIAFECSIRDPHYFNKQFRRICGASPSLYRQQNGKK